MKRRDFLKLIAVTPIAPSVLAAMPKKELTVAAAREFVNFAQIWSSGSSESTLFNIYADGRLIYSVTWNRPLSADENAVLYKYPFAVLGKNNELLH